jgi:hypothetical protein
MNCNIISVLHSTDVDNIVFHYIPHLVPQYSPCFANEKPFCIESGSDCRSEANVSSCLTVLNLAKTVLRFFGTYVVVCSVIL